MPELAALTANYINWDTSPEYRNRRIHFIVEVCGGGRISFAGGKWQGWWLFDPATQQLRGAFNARGDLAAAHDFNVNRLAAAPTNLRWIHWSLVVSSAKQKCLA